MSIYTMLGDSTKFNYADCLKGVKKIFERMDEDEKN